MKSKCIKLKNDLTLIIRKARKDDAAKILEYLNRIAGETDYLTFGPGEFHLSVTDEENSIQDYINSANQIFLLAEIDNVVVGCLTFKAIDRPRIRHAGIFGMSVVKEYWGLGIGKILIENLIEWARLCKIIRKINLKVRADNTRAIELYKRFGFIQEGLITREHYFKGSFYDCIAMGIQID